MVELLPMDFVRKIYNFLTNGNDDVNFYCMCVQNRNREAATNSPIKFALNLIKINMVCRLPFAKNRLFSKEIGKDFLSGLFVRPTITEIASGILDNNELIFDLYGCCFTTVRDKYEIFKMIEKTIGIYGFAEKRMSLENKGLTLDVIYKQLSKHFLTEIDEKFELRLMEKHLFRNNYIIRLIDIAKYNDMKITAVDNSPYPRNFTEQIMDRFSIYADRLIFLSGNPDELSHTKSESPQATAILSSDYNGFIKRFLKLGCKPFYYRNPKTLMQKVRHPKLDKNFCDIYDGLSGIRLFDGIKRRSFCYELAYLCVAPAVIGFAKKVAEHIKNNEKMICLCEENSVFVRVFKIFCKSDNIVYFPWSALASNKYKPIDTWVEIIKETPVFDYAYSGIFDSCMRYPIADTKKSTQMLARVMATAWKDKSSDYTNEVVLRLCRDADNITVVSPIPGKYAAFEFCQIINSVNKNASYTSYNISNYLNCSNERLKLLAEIIKGNDPYLAQIQKDKLSWVYSKKLSTTILQEIYSAVIDFAKDVYDYENRSGESVKISGSDASALFNECYENVLKIMHKEEEI